MGVQLIDENKIRELPDEERFSTCEYILKNENDESKRWDAVWLIGELAENKNEGESMFDRVAEIIGGVVKNDNNVIVKHEACYQIAARNMRKIIPILVDAALNGNYLSHISCSNLITCFVFYYSVIVISNYPSHYLCYSVKHGIAFILVFI